MQTLDTSWLRPSSISLRVVVWFLLGIIQSKTPLWFIDMISSYIQGNNSSHSCVWSSLSTSSKLIKPKWNTCCVSVQGLHPSEEHSKAVPIWRLLQTLLLFGGCTATILRGLTYPAILCTPEKAERNRENGDIAWRRSSLLWAWAAEIVM